MTELEAIDRDIRSLKELLRVAWMELASPLLTPHQRREARNRITLCSTELRRHIQDTELRTARKQAAEEPGAGGRAKPTLRLLPEGY
jgi:hypothetical protein